MFNKELIAKFAKLPTPFYFYDTDLLRNTLAAISNAASRYGYHLHYALKANANHRILEMINSFGIGADCVSGYEVQRALDCGFSPDHIAFAGVGKSDAEISLALDHNIWCFNCESLPEIEVIAQLAAQKGKKARIALRINPNINAHTHEYITTGLEENKFGIQAWQLEAVVDRVRNMPEIELTGIHFHVGSHITDLNVFKSLCLKINDLQQWFYTNQIILDHINVGGGLGIDYERPEAAKIPDFDQFFGLFHEFLELRPRQKLHFEPGRSIVGQCGSLITKVLYVKEGANTKFAIVDAGMSDLIRPALYQAYHKIVNLNGRTPNEKYDVVGPICESSDTFGKAVALPETKRNDLLAILSAGAYGQIMASNYNLRPFAKAYYSDEI